MRYVAAYLLAALGGKATPGAADVKSILSSVGAECDEERLNQLLAQLEGKDLADVIADGVSQLASVPSGGGGGAAPAAGGGGGGGGGAEPAAEKAPEPAEESEEEEDMGFSLFD